MKIELDKSFRKAISQRINGYNFLVGVLEDKPHFDAARGKAGLKGQDVLKTYAGGPARKQTRHPSEKTSGQILVDNMKRLGINILLKPFQDKSSELLRFTEAFLKMALAKSSPKRVENLLQANVRNPILRGEYGQNSSLTKTIKGFNRPLIDTAQMFKAIKAKVKRVRG